MRSAIKKLLPATLYGFAKRMWQKVRPPQIVITTFVRAGCRFEISSRKEKSRVRSLANEKKFIQLILSEIQPGDVAFDVSSCVGMHSLHAALLGAKVVAFEPDPSYRKRLNKNIKINRLKKKIQVENRAVSDRKAKATLYTDGVNGKSPSLRVVGKQGSITVQSNTLDCAVFQGMLPVPDLVQLDIDGAEIPALRGMKHLLTSEAAPPLLVHRVARPALGAI